VRLFVGRDQSQQTDAILARHAASLPRRRLFLMLLLLLLIGYLATVRSAVKR